MTNTVIQKNGCVVFLALVFAFPVGAEDETPAPEKLYWFWSTDCRAVDLRLRISIDELQNYEWSVPLCHGTWKERELAGNKISIEKKLETPREISWSGYTDEVQVSPAGDKIEGKFWLAGAEPDGMIIGVTFFSESLDSILMNTIFYASHDSESSIEIAPGVIVRSTPTGYEYGIDPRVSWDLPSDSQP
jgi:hypothetical protein